MTGYKNVVGFIKLYIQSHTGTHNLLLGPVTKNATFMIKTSIYKPGQGMPSTNRVSAESFYTILVSVVTLSHHLPLTNQSHPLSTLLPQPDPLSDIKTILLQFDEYFKEVHLIIYGNLKIKNLLHICIVQ